jgi:hypothetical protein
VVEGISELSEGVLLGERYRLARRLEVFSAGAERVAGVEYEYWLALDVTSETEVWIQFAAADGVYADGAALAGAVTALRRINHPAVPAVHAFGEYEFELDGEVTTVGYCAMPALAGETLAAVLLREELDQAEILAALAQVAEVLELLAEFELVHGHLSARSVLLIATEGAGYEVVIADLPASLAVQTTLESDLSVAADVYALAWLTVLALIGVAVLEAEFGSEFAVAAELELLAEEVVQRRGEWAAENLVVLGVSEALAGVLLPALGEAGLRPRAAALTAALRAEWMLLATGVEAEVVEEVAAAEIAAEEVAAEEVVAEEVIAEEVVAEEVVAEEVVEASRKKSRKSGAAKGAAAAAVVGAVVAAEIAGAGTAQAAQGAGAGAAQGTGASAQGAGGAQAAQGAGGAQAARGAGGAQAAQGAGAGAAQGTGASAQGAGGAQAAQGAGGAQAAQGAGGAQAAQGAGAGAAQGAGASAQGAGGARAAQGAGSAQAAQGAGAGSAQAVGAVAGAGAGAVTEIIPKVPRGPRPRTGAGAGSGAGAAAAAGAVGVSASSSNSGGHHGPRKKPKPGVLIGAGIGLVVVIALVIAITSGSSNKSNTASSGSIGTATPSTPSASKSAGATSGAGAGSSASASSGATSGSGGSTSTAVASGSETFPSTLTTVPASASQAVQQIQSVVNQAKGELTSTEQAQLGQIISTLTQAIGSGQSLSSGMTQFWALLHSNELPTSLNTYLTQYAEYLSASQGS